MRRNTLMLLFAAALSAGSAHAGEDAAGDKSPGDKSTADKTTTAAPAAEKSIYGFEMTTIDGEKVKLDKYKGDVLIVVNVASQCGLTDRNYKYLEPMYQKYKDKGLRVLAFPANNFGAQEPGPDAEIKKFCTEKYNVTFDLFSKISVMGDDQCDLYKYLTEETDQPIRGPIKWNFQKYLVSRDGKILHKFLPSRESHEKELDQWVQKALGQPDDQADKGE